MFQQLNLVEPTVGRLELVEPVVRRLDPAKIAAALGAEPESEKVPEAGPLTLYALRTELYRRRQTNGGQPASPAADDRDNVAVNDSDWARLQLLATELGGANASPSASQVGSILLSLALDCIKPTAAEANGQGPEQLLAKRLAEKFVSQT